MNWHEALFLIALSAVGTLLCGLFAGLETGVYSLNRVRLRRRPVIVRKWNFIERIARSMASGRTRFR